MPRKDAKAQALQRTGSADTATEATLAALEHSGDSDALLVGQTVRQALKYAKTFRGHPDWEIRLRAAALLAELRGFKSRTHQTTAGPRVVVEVNLAPFARPDGPGGTIIALSNDVPSPEGLEANEITHLALPGAT